MADLQSIFKSCADAYTNSHSLPPHVVKVINAIKKCRTPEMGAHIIKCSDPNCDYNKIQYNSCRNRHCPQCQTLTKVEWIEARKSELLDVPYFHVVFTIPDALNMLLLHNSAILYSLLFKSASQTLLALAENPSFLGAQAGAIAILHTWGQNLLYHPHIHCIVPGGGLSMDGITFRESRKNFFIPVKLLGKVFRGKFMDELKKLYRENELKLPEKFDFCAAKEAAYNVNWHVYCKPTFQGPESVIEYLGRYTHRVAISNERIISHEDGKVSFRWRDYRDNNKQKIMTLSEDEFIRRFLLHILPRGFCKIRHYGVLSNRNKKTKLVLCQRYRPTRFIVNVKKSKREILQKILGRDIFVCPCCGSLLISEKMFIQKE
jgi:hypothetical protein